MDDQYITHSIEINNFTNTRIALEAYAGEHGRIMNVSDLLKKRYTDTSVNSVWKTEHITSSAEYIGHSKSGIPIAVICHSNNQPFNNAEDWFNVSSQNRKGTRDDFIPSHSIPDYIFHDLLDGKYGEDISIIDLSLYPTDMEIDFPDTEAIINDQWTCARMGGDKDIINTYVNYVVKNQKDNNRFNKNSILEFEFLKVISLLNKMKTNNIAVARLLQLHRFNSFHIGAKPIFLPSNGQLKHHNIGVIKPAKIKNNSNLNNWDELILKYPEISMEKTPKNYDIPKCIEIKYLNDGKIVGITPDQNLHKINFLEEVAGGMKEVECWYNVDFSHRFEIKNTIIALKNTPDESNAFTIKVLRFDNVKNAYLYQVTYYKADIDYKNRYLNKETLSERPDIMLKLLERDDQCQII